MLDLHVQWLTTPPAGWEKYTVDDWPGLPKKSDPLLGGSVVDGDKGILALICICGQEFGQDHIALESGVGDKIVMSGWSQNAMAGTGLPIAKVHTLGEEIVTSVREYDPWPGTHIKETLTGFHHELTVYVDEQHWPTRTKYCITGEVIFRPYEDFVPPSENVTRHTAVVSDELWVAHQAYKNPTP